VTQALAGAAILSGIVEAKHLGVGLLSLFAGTVFAYVSFWYRDQALMRAVVGGIGLLYLLGGLLLATLMVFLRFPYQEEGFVLYLGNAILGAISVLVAKASTADSDAYKED